MLAGTFPEAYSWDRFSGDWLRVQEVCSCGRRGHTVLATTGSYDPFTKKVRPLKLRTLCEECYAKTPSKFRFRWSTMAIADAEQTKFISQFPALPKWWQHTKELAQRQGYLQSPWGFKHHFYCVLKPEERVNEHTGVSYTTLVDGPDANAAVSFNPQHAGGMIGRESLLLFGQTWLRKHMPSNGFIHDGWIFDVPEGRKSECIEVIEKVLPRPIKALGGLRIGCEISIGEKNWADMRTVKSIVV